MVPFAEYYYSPEKIQQYFDNFFDVLKESWIQTRSPQLFRDRNFSHYQHLRENYRHENKVDWLMILVTYVGRERLEEFPFYYRGKEFFGADSPYVTSKHISIDQIEKRGVLEDRTTENPEQILISEEKVGEQQTILNDLIGNLDEWGRELVTDFRNEEDVPQDKLLEIVKILQENVTQEHREIYYALR